MGRRRQADGKDGTDTRFFLPNLGGGGGCNCGKRKRRQAPHEDDAGTRFFGLENLLGGGSNCGCNCGGQNGGYNNGYNNGGYNNGGCPDSRPSKRFPNNPWSYQACNQYS